MENESEIERYTGKKIVFSEAIIYDYGGKYGLLGGESFRKYHTRGKFEVLMQWDSAEGL